MKKKQLLIAVVTFTFYSLNPMAYDEKLEMEEDDKHTTTLIKSHITYSTLPKNRR